ncbi:MAG: ferredoxin [Actinomycetes bacterium]
MKIAADYDLCQGHAECTVEAPEVFVLGDNDQVRIVDASPAAELADKVRAAVRYCPTHALTLEEG